MSVRCGGRSVRGIRRLSSSCGYAGVLRRRGEGGSKGATSHGRRWRRGPSVRTHAIVRCGHCGVVLWRLLDAKQIAAAFSCTCGQRLRLTRLCASAAGGVAV